MISTLVLTLTIASGWMDPTRPRAMWVWKTDSILQDKAARRSFFAFLAAPKSNPKARISVIFFACKITDPHYRDSLPGFLAEAHRRSVRVDYLCGDPSYALAAHMGSGLVQLGNVLLFNEGAPANSRFDGIQYDVEPYSLPGWPAQSLLNSFVEFLGMCRSCIALSKQSLAFGVAIPRWYDGPDLHGLYKSVLDRVDYVAVMDYVSTPKLFVSEAANTVKYASEQGKGAWLGAEVSELPTEKTATFFALGNAKLEEAFAAAENAFRKSKGFDGVAIEWYDTYVNLKP